MTDFPARIKPKKSSVAGEVPQASDLEVAEIAVNTADGKLFVKHTDDTIKEISGTGGDGGGGGTSDVRVTRDLEDVTDVLPTTGQVLRWRSAEEAPIEVLTRPEFTPLGQNDNTAAADTWVWEAGAILPTSSLYVQASPNNDDEYSVRFPKDYNSYIENTTGDPDALIGLDDWTIEQWISVNELPEDIAGTISTLYTVHDRSLGNSGLVYNFSLIYTNDQVQLLFTHAADSTGSTQTNFYSTALSESDLTNVTWHHAAVQLTGNTLYFFWDGQPVGSTAFTSGGLPAVTNSNKSISIGSYRTLPRKATVTLHGLRVTTVALYPIDGSNFTPPLVYSGLPASYVPANLGLDELSDVAYANGLLEIDDLKQIRFEPQPNQPAGHARGIYNNNGYGLAVGSWTPGIDNDFAQGRTYYSSERGIIHDVGKNDDDRAVYIGHVASDLAYGETPGLRFAGDNVTINQAPDHYVGLRLPTEWRGQLDYRLPQNAPTASSSVLVSDPAGNWSWLNRQELSTAVPPLTDTVGSAESYANTEAPTVQFDSAAEGDLLLLSVFVANGADSTGSVINRNFALPAGWTQEVQSTFVNAANNTDNALYALYSKVATAGDLGTPITITTDTTDPEDDWMIGGAAYAGAEVISTGSYNTTIPGNDLPASGYDYRSPLTSSQLQVTFVARGIPTAHKDLSLPRRKDTSRTSFFRHWGMLAVSAPPGRLVSRLFFRLQSYRRIRCGQP